MGVIGILGGFSFINHAMQRLPLFPEIFYYNEAHLLALEHCDMNCILFYGTFVSCHPSNTGLKFHWVPYSIAKCWNNIHMGYYILSLMNCNTNKQENVVLIFDLI